MRKINALIVTVIAHLCCTAVSAHDFEVDGIYYDITSSSDLTVSVTYQSSYNSAVYSGSVAIPEKVTYDSKEFSVTSIGGYAFYCCSGLKSVDIPNSVTSIEYSAFSGCSGLTSVTIPNSVTSIGEDAFSGCSGLTSVTIPNSVTSIGEDAFWGCSSLTSVTIPNSVTSIGEYAFLGCSGLKTIEVEYGNTKYDSRDKCNAIIETNTNTLIVGCKNTVIPNSVTSIGDRAFYYCSGLTSVDIPNSVTSIEDYAFSGCKSLYYVYNSSKLDITKGATSHGYVAYYAKKVYNYEEKIDDYLFTTDEETGVHYLCGYAGNATELNLPKNYKGNNYCIADGAFRNCINITSVTIPNSVTSIGSSAFEDCSGLTAVHISDLSAWCKIEFEDYRSNPTFYAHHLYLNGEEIINLVIPGDVTSIGDWAFRNCSDITSVTIPNSVTSIGDSAFRGCSGLTSVTIPNSVTSIGSSAFEDCSGLTAVHISDLSAWCKIEFEDYHSNPTFYAHRLYLNGEEIVNLVIPGDVTSIGDWAFRNCSDITSVTIPNSVTSISKFGFFGCTGLTAIKVDSENTKYDSRDNCNAIIETETNTLITGCKNTVIPNSVTIIGEYAFFELKGMPTITIPKSVEKICYGALGYFDNSPEIKNINIEELSQAFNIKEDNGAYFNYFLSYRKLLLNGKEISELVIPEGVDTVSGILTGASQFKSLVIPKTVKEISTKIFVNCKELMCIYTNSVTPPAIKTNFLFPGFSDNTYNNATLYVPKDGYDLYTSTAPWSSFANIKIFTNTTDVTFDKTSIKMVEGETVTLSATVYPEDATDKTIVWISSDESIAKISENGVVTALKAGRAIITASSKVCPTVTATCEITVNTKISAITLNKAAAEIVEGESLVLTATVSPEDATDKTVIWTSSDESIAKISKNGVVTALKAGRAIITASSKVCPTVTATCEVVVKAKTVTVTGITLDKTTAEITEGETLTLTATVSPENATDKTVTWISSDESIAKVINGIVIGVKAGKATIIASCGDKVATCEITVNAKVIPATGITLDKTTVEMTEGETLTLTATVTPENATDKTVVWTSSDETVATVANGVVTALKAGKATITAKSGEVSATCEITVNAKVIPATGITLDKTTAELTEGETLTLTATVSPEDATDKTVVWTSSDETVATVANGVVTALKAGKATITAKSGEVSATCEITVNAKVIPATGITLDKTTAEMTEGETLTLTATVTPEDATDKTVTWTSSDETVATVANGVVTALKAGKATITAKSGEVSATCEITVIAKVIPATGISLDKTTAEMIEGETLSLTATVTPENATDKTVTWASSDEAVAKVVNGVVSALKTGKATITATSGDVSATCEITVIPVTGINGVICSDGYAAGNVYTVAGNLVCRKGEKLSNLPKGLYIVDGKKIVVK